MRKEPKKQPARTLEARKSSFYFDFYSHWLTAASKHMDIYLFIIYSNLSFCLSVFLSFCLSVFPRRLSYLQDSLQLFICYFSFSWSRILRQSVSLSLMDFSFVFLFLVINYLFLLIKNLSIIGWRRAYLRCRLSCRR